MPDILMLEIQWYIIAAAFVLDFLLGDPAFLPHPVIWMGNAISFFEPRFRKLIKSPFFSGLMFALFLIGSTWAIALIIVNVAGMIHPICRDLVQIIMLFYCFSCKSLEKAAIAVHTALEEKDLAKARQKVAMIVGRETGGLSETAVTRAGVETVAENFVDGFVSPLFFALIGGAPLAMAYKMVNTLDSMVGYKNDTYRFFGRASARIDDAANFIPARLSVVILSMAALLISWQRAASAWRTGFKEGRKHKSPNAGFPEAAVAGALYIRLGGPNVYHGILVEKPFIGSRFKDPDTGKIKQACDLMLAGCFFSTVAACLLAGFFQILTS